MRAQGLIVKMPTTLGGGSAVRYTLRLEEQRSGANSPSVASAEIALNELVGSTVHLSHDGTFACIRCGRTTDKTFAEGFCYPCFRDAPEASECIVRPELCEAHLGRGRDPAWEQEHHYQPHAVYFAVSSALKVGVTRETQIPTRWIDQGADWAVQIARVPYRQLAGRIEVALKDLYTDRTSWQKMLKGTPPEPFTLEEELDRVYRRVATVAGDERPLTDFLIAPSEAVPLQLRYPVTVAPQKVKSLNLANMPDHEGVLTGVRGQYLIFDGGIVLNVRRHSGYRIHIDW